MITKYVWNVNDWTGINTTLFKMLCRRCRSCINSSIKCYARLNVHFNTFGSFGSICDRYAEDAYRVGDLCSTIRPQGVQSFVVLAERWVSHFIYDMQRPPGTYARDGSLYGSRADIEHACCVGRTLKCDFPPHMKHIYSIHVFRFGGSDTIL